VSFGSGAVTEPRPFLRRAILLLFGERPRAILLVVAPTLLAIGIDLVTRPRSLAGLPAYDVMNYVGSALVGALFSGSLLWFVSALFLVRAGRARLAARAALAIFFGGVFLPFAFFVYGAQPLYYAVFHAYISRDTVRLGMRLRGTVFSWLASWGGSVVAMAVAAVVVTALAAVLVRRAAAPLATASRIAPALGLLIATVCLWNDWVETRVFQAAPPDACFLNGAMHALRMRVTRAGDVTRGVTLRTPDPLPPLAPAAHRPNVVVILSESLRADAVCSERREGCAMRFLDEVAPERVGLGELTAQASGTFTSCMVLWTGLAPDADFQTAHRAPMLWEVAHAVGYRTAYIASQNLRYEDMATYVERAGIDVKAGAFDLGEVLEQQIGGPDEYATARTLAFVREQPPSDPYFALLHLCNTHAPYRVDPALQPFEPHDAKPWGDTEKLHNHYRNSVLQQERTVAAFLRELRATPQWDDTVVLFLSDHGEQFREHGRLYHLNTIFDEEVRVPGWVLAGPRALDDAQRSALATFAHRRTYTGDVHATVIDLLGVHDAEGTLPFADRVQGRSLLRPRPSAEPAALMSTTSGVWEADDPKFGVRRGNLLLIGSETRPFACFDNRTDPRERTPAPLSKCGPALLGIARQHFPQVP
jgi:glucan phosphoethanolaminetransferase (alkaline phosphatase superfamily)